MDRLEIITITKKFLSEEFEVDINSIMDHENLRETLDLDSLDYVDLVVLIEENLGFKPTADDLQLRRLGTLKSTFRFHPNEV
jgi:acyl carrier protein